MGLLRNNLLNRALRLIPPETFQHVRFNGDTLNDFGVSVPNYSEPITLKGSVQVPELVLYQQLGLELEKNYRIFYGAQLVQGNETQRQPDRFIYKSKTYEVVKNTPWFEYDGWCGVLAVEIKTNDN